MTALLEFTGIRKEFHDTRRGTTTIAIDGLDLTVGEGEFVCVVGPSGCGKSTLLAAAAGNDTVSSGEVLFEGRPIRGQHADRGMVFQDGAIFSWLTALENVSYGPRVRGIPKREYLPRSRAALEAVGLGAFADHYPRQLSGGMRQRVAIARALNNAPKLLLMDEPFGALDAQTRSTLQNLLLEVRQEFAGAVVFVTHDVDEAVLLADRVVVMSARPGRIVLDLAIDLPRPRSSDIDTDPRFVALKKAVRDALTH